MSAHVSLQHGQGNAHCKEITLGQISMPQGLLSHKVMPQGCTGRRHTKQDDQRMQCSQAGARSDKCKVTNLDKVQELERDGIEDSYRPFGLTHVYDVPTLVKESNCIHHAIVGSWLAAFAFTLCM